MSVEVSLRHSVGAFALEVDSRLQSRVSPLCSGLPAGQDHGRPSIAGLVTPRQGHIAIDGRVVLDTRGRIDVHLMDGAWGWCFRMRACFRI